MLIEEQPKEQKKSFKTGISYYVPNNGIEWIDSSQKIKKNSTSTYSLCFTKKTKTIRLRFRFLYLCKSKNKIIKQ